MMKAIEDSSKYYHFQLEFKINIVNKSGQKAHLVHLMNVDNQ